MAYRAEPVGTRVLHFPESGKGSGHVRHGNFWLPETNLGQFFWETWIKPGDNNDARYWLSDGWGGAHAALLGFTQVAPGAVLTPAGNVYNGSFGTGFLVDEGVWPFEWCHLAYSWGPDAAASGALTLFVYLNGIPIGRLAFPGPRQSGSTVIGAGNDLYIGGSNHSQFNGWIAQIRAFEAFNPLSYGRLSFCPDDSFTPESYDNAGNYTDCAFLADYTLGGQNVPDLSPTGFDGVDQLTGQMRHHPGAIFGTENGAINRGMPTNSPSTYPRPHYVIDPTCPVGCLGPKVVPTLDVPTAKPVPVGAKLFDNFDRMQQNYAFQVEPTLGSTVGGSLGVKTWEYHGPTNTGVSSPVWGIRSGRATYLGRAPAGVAVVESGLGDIDLRVSRLNGSNGVNGTGLCFRLQDRDNFWFAYSISDGAAIRVGGYLSGTYQLPNNGDSTPAFNGYSTAAVPNWTRLRVVLSGTTMTVYVGIESGLFDANGFPLFTWTQIGQLTSQTSFQTATKHGITSVPYTAFDISGMTRYDDFEGQ